MKNVNIYITGLGFYTPLGLGKNANLDRLRSGLSGNVTLPGVKFDDYVKWSEPFKPTEFSQVFILACQDAFFDAKLNGEENTDKIGCIMESEVGTADCVDDYLTQLLIKKKGIISPMLFTKTVSNTALGDFSRYFKLRGPSSMMLSESSVNYAFDLILHRMTDIVICGAIDIKTSEEELMEHTPEANYQRVHGSGCVAVVLESEESMRKRGVVPYAQLSFSSEKFDFQHTDSDCNLNLQLTEATIRKDLELREDDVMLHVCSTRESLNQTTQLQNLWADKPIHDVDICYPKDFTFDMLYGSTMFELAVASLSVSFGEFYRVGQRVKYEAFTKAFVSSKREGGMNSYFLLNKITE